MKMEENITELLRKYGRIFIVPLDHPLGEDTKKLSEIGISNFVKKVENLKSASASFGRNIFESDNPEERINFVLEVFHRS